MDMDDARAAARIQAVANELGVPVELLHEVAWDIHDHLGNSGTQYGHYIEFSEETPRELLDKLGVASGEYIIYLSSGLGNEYEPDDPNEHVAYLARQYKHLGGANGAIKIGDVVLLNPWSPSAPAAQEFWDKNIGVLPVEDRQPFLIELLRHA